MINELKESLWKQFGASIDMLNNAIMLLPEEYWNSDKRFFYITYHSLTFLDYYLTIPPTDYRSQLSFTITDPEEIPEEALDDIIPDRIYSKKELLGYLQASRLKCRELIDGITKEKIKQRWIEEPDELSAYVTLQFSTLEILLDNNKSKDWKDLFILNGGKYHIMKFDGKKYPSNPSVQNELKVIPGDGLPRALNFVNELYPWFKF